MNYFKALVDTVRENIQPKETKPQIFFEKQDSSIKKPYFRQKFTKENKNEASDWLMDLEKNDTQKLRKVLEEAGIDRRNFQKKIYCNETMKKVWKIKIREEIGGKKYSQALENLFQGNCSDDGQRIDRQYVETVMDVGGGVRFYNYLLIDSRLCRKDTNKVEFEEFIGAAFYIGKGTENRAIDHLKDALKFDDYNQNQALKNLPKLSYINEIWREEGAVYVLRLFHDVHEDVAHLREEAMITAFGLTNLTNDRHGHQFKRPRGYTREMLPIHGAFLLHKAFHVFVNNLPQPIRKHNMHYAPERFEFGLKQGNS
ncbi:unnamed protein product, partial [Mesorhabditis belari]|uniref:Uncharacterized protein n=1 Tax=Mesorhabditis belari TaxID=2138241 RepID=A0AAF3FEB8_9BILA